MPAPTPPAPTPPEQTLPELTLYITNRNYSSWSLRAWLVIGAFDIPFDEVLVQMNDEGHIPELAAISPTGKVPCLVVRNAGSQARPVTIWESIAIVEFLAERFPDRGIWPVDSSGRAVARALAAEMHGGFTALRQECPMNLRREPVEILVSDACRADIARCEDIFLTSRLASGGPFMMGDFSAVDAFYAPVYSRLMTYALSSHPAVLQFGTALADLPAWLDWVEAAMTETDVVAADEV